MTVIKAVINDYHKQHNGTKNISKKYLRQDHERSKMELTDF